VALFGHALAQEDPFPVKKAAWYHKQVATFSDVVALVRRHLWGNLTFPTSPSDPDVVLVPRLTLARARSCGLLLTRNAQSRDESVRDNLVRLLPEGRKHPAAVSAMTPALATPREAAFLFLRRPEDLRNEEQETLCKLRQLHLEVDHAYDLVQQFALMLRSRTGAHLDAWLAHVASSNLPELQSFATGIEKDQEAVRNGLTWSINNGMVEGCVTKLKLIKRTMYSRASFALLRQRVLHAA
jgi:hypothetical protein